MPGGGFSTGRIRMFPSEIGSFALADEALLSFENVIRVLYQDECWSEKFTEQRIERDLARLVLTLNAGPRLTRARELVSELEQDYSEHSIEHLVVLPILNLKMEDRDEWDVGQVVLRQMTTARRAELMSQVRSVTGGSRSSKEVIEVAERTYDEWLKGLEGSVVSEARFVAEAERARERAVEETLRALDILNVAASWLYSSGHGHQVHVGLAGDSQRAERALISISSESVSFNLAVVGPITPFVLGEGAIKLLESSGVMKLSTLLQKRERDRSEFEDLVLRSLRWTGNAQREYEPGDRLVSLMVALEALWSVEDRPVAANVSEGTAFALGETTVLRMTIRDHMKRLYKLRSRVLHGNRQVVTESDVAQLREFAHATLLWAIEQPFKKQEELLGWLDEQRMS